MRWLNKPDPERQRHVFLFHMDLWLRREMGVERNYLEKGVGLRKVRENDLKGWGGMEHDQNTICLYENRTMKYTVLIMNRYKSFLK